MSVTHQEPAPDQPSPARRGFVLKGWMVFAAIALIIAGFGLFTALDEPDRTPAEEAYLAALTVNMDEDFAVNAGHAACDLVSTSSEQIAKEWLAGVDDFSRLGAVERNPNPLPAAQANAVVEAAVVHLCGASGK